MNNNNYTIIDFEIYLNQKQKEFIEYRKNGVEFVNKKLIEIGRTLGEYPEIWKVKKTELEDVHQMCLFI